MTDPSGFEFNEQPRAREPVLVAGFSGWPDAGEVSSNTLRYLTSGLSAKAVARLSVDPFHDYAAQRPTGLIRQGRLRGLELPRITLHFADQTGGPDLLLLAGPEPHHNWGGLAAALLEVCDRFGVTLIVTVGGTYDAVPHTVEPPVSGVANLPGVIDRFQDRVAFLDEYRGPISFHSFLSRRAAARGLGCLGLWGHAPSYIQTGNLAVVERLVRTVADILEIRIDRTGLRQSSAELLRHVDDLMAENPKLKTYVRELEKDYSERIGRLDEADRKVISITPFLKRNDDPSGPRA
ncbi:MAG: PAC2 family protein [Proteobacteria bacterium]|nr:PAC2 family protein [Pseudomonadota bacterium]